MTAAAVMAMQINGGESMCLLKRGYFNTKKILTLPLVLPARVVDITQTANSAQALIRLDVGGTHILSRITLRSVAMLDVKPDMLVYAQVKSVALMR